MEKQLEFKFMEEMRKEEKKENLFPNHFYENIKSASLFLKSVGVGLGAYTLFEVVKNVKDLF